MYFISLGLQAPESDYPNLRNALEALGPWSNRMPNLWMVESRLSSRKIRDLLKPHLRPNDRLMVAQITRNWAGTGMGDGFPEWMSRRTFDGGTVVVDPVKPQESQ
jgi:hypothetical protein